MYIDKQSIIYKLRNVIFVLIIICLLYASSYGKDIYDRVYWKYNDEYILHTDDLKKEDIIEKYGKFDYDAFIKKEYDENKDYYYCYYNVYDKFGFGDNLKGRYYIYFFIDDHEVIGLFYKEM